MDEEERSRAIEYLTRTINDEMGLREQLEIIRILNPEKKPRMTDTQFIIGQFEFYYFNNLINFNFKIQLKDLKIIDDDKYKRIKDVIKIYGIFLSDKPINDNSSDCSAISCPLSRVSIFESLEKLKKVKKISLFEMNIDSLNFLKLICYQF